jgi:response regulator RpfG family c-di-GMP phosphodiesterase
LFKQRSSESNFAVDLSENKLVQSHIIFVDDNEEMLDLVNLLIRNKFEKILLNTFRSAEEALFFLISNKERIPINLIISDYQMNEKNGIEFFLQLKNNNINLPFVLLTAQRDPLIQLSSKKVGIKHFFIKDFNNILKILSNIQSFH